jgi:hypothetical protein
MINNLFTILYLHTMNIFAFVTFVETVNSQNPQNWYVFKKNDLLFFFKTSTNNLLLVSKIMTKIIFVCFNGIPFETLCFWYISYPNNFAQSKSLLLRTKNKLPVLKYRFSYKYLWQPLFYAWLILIEYGSPTAPTDWHYFSSYCMAYLHLLDRRLFWEWRSYILETNPLLFQHLNVSYCGKQLTCKMTNFRFPSFTHSLTHEAEWALEKLPIV